MSLWLRLANRLILDNSQDYIDPGDRERIPIACDGYEIEAWVTTGERDGDESKPPVFTLKFPGTGGRAERAGPHPGEIIASNRFESWTIKPTGYGTSDGKACVTTMPATCDAAWKAIEARAEGNPIVVTGNSLGGLYALYIAARYEIAGLFLRNPAPIHELIRGRYSWWNLGLASRMIGRQVPAKMNAIDNARCVTTPVFHVMSDSDRMIPPDYQLMIINACAGKTTTFVLNNADHHTPLGEDQAESYRSAVEEWSASL